MTPSKRDAALRRGEERLRGELDRLRRRLDDRVESTIRDLEGRVSQPLLEAFTSAMNAHQALLRETGLDTLVHPVAATEALGTPRTPGGAAAPDQAEAAEPNRTLESSGHAVDEVDGEPPGQTVAPRNGEPAELPPWKALSAYRRGLGTRVLDPLDQALARIRPAHGVEERWTRFQEQLSQLHRGCPVYVDRPEPEGLYRPAAGDGPLTVTGKLVVRTARGLGRGVTAPFRGLANLAGNRTAARPLRLQKVPLQALVRDRLRGADPAAWQTLGDELWRHHASPLAHLEQALSAFNRAWYPVEVAQQGPEDLLDEALAGRLEHILAEAAAPPGDEDAAPAPEGSAPPTDEDDQPFGEGPGDGSREDPEASTAVEEDSSEPTESAAPGDPAGPGEQEAEQTGDAGKPVRTVVEAIRQVEAALSRAASTPIPEELFGRIREAGRETWTAFVDTVDRSDSFHGARGEARRDRAFQRAATRYEARSRRWHSWYAAARAEIHFSALVIVLRNHWDDAHADLINGVGQEGLVDLADQWLEARDHLLSLHREAVASHDLTPEAIRDRPQKVAETLDRWLEIANTELRDHLLEPMDRHQVLEVITRIADDASEEFSRIASRLPESVELNTPQVDPARVVPGVPRRTVAVRALVSQTLDAFRVEAIRTSPAPLLAVLEQAAAECAEIPRVVEYNLTAARDEVLSEEHGPSDAPGDETSGTSENSEPPPDTPVETGTPGADGEAVSWEEEVESLTLQGLARTAQGVETLLSLFGPAWRQFVETVNETLPPTFVELHRRAVAEGMVREQIHGLRAFFRQKGRLGWKEIRSFGDNLLREVRKTWRRLRPRLRSLLRLSRIAVGAPATAGDEERALEVFRTIPELVAPLPLVYRRLFSFQAVTDPTLLSGREDELDWFADRYAGWQADRPAPSIVVAPPGAGVTSLFNVLDASLLKDVCTVRIEFDQRVESQDELARQLAEVLGVETFSGSLRDLGHRVMAGEAASGCRAVLLEGLEYLQFRSAQGGRLLSRLLEFLGHTTSRIFWVCSISEAAWSLVTVRSPVAASLVHVLKLEPLTRDQVESSIMQRHRRSGLPLVFLPPADLNPLKARALKRARTQEERQAILQEDFFDRIYRLSRSSSAMADVLWLRSLDMEAREGQVHARAGKSVRFAFLESVTSEMDFALMALMEHGSLTAEECAEVLQLPEHEMLGIFEALRTRMLLQDVVDEDSIPRPVQELSLEASYRIPQILGMAVTERLRSLNILH